MNFKTIVKTFTNCFHLCIHWRQRVCSAVDQRYELKPIILTNIKTVTNFLIHINTFTDVLPAVPLVVRSPYLSTWMTSRQLMG